MALWKCCCRVKKDFAFCKFIRLLLLTVLFFSNTAANASVEKSISPDDNNFPVVSAIRPNVNFWIRIFTQVSQSQGLLHDSENLSIVYDIVKLDDSQTLRAKRKNKKIKKTAVKKYKKILLTLSEGNPARSMEEKKIAALFGDSPAPSDFKKAAFRIRIQTGLKEEFKNGLIRSGAFIDEFRRIFRSMGLPEDLVYLPCVESSYQYRAYSKFGAAGIWQFTRSTGRLYMKIDYVVDERRDPFLSTLAAARLLKRNMEKLGHWPLAITAYNHGLNGMLRAKNAKGSYENIYNSYKSRSFKFASKNFYSEFLAARAVAKNYKTYFGELSFDKPMSFHTVKTKGYLSAVQLAQRLNISLETLKQLNPALRPPVFNEQKYIPKNHSLRLPDHISISAKDKTLTALYRDRQKPSRFHRVQKGDTAGAIARMNNVSLTDLILANNLNKRSTIYVGQNLRIPSKGERFRQQKIAAVNPMPAPEISGRALEKNNPEPPPEKPLPQEPEEKQSQAAQPLFAAKENGHIPVNTDIYSGNLNVFNLHKINHKKVGSITVEAEETLGHYADWLGIKTNLIRKLNGFRYGRPITVGQKMLLPVDKKTAARFEEQRYEYHKEMEEDFFTSFEIQGLENYRIKKGDNIWTLCLNELEVPFWLLKKINPEMNFNRLVPSQTIKYPLIISRSENRE